MSTITKKLLSNQECHGLLASRLPKWNLSTTEEGIWIQRRFQTRNWSLTLHAANTVGFLSEIGWHHPRLILEYDCLQVELYSHDVSGITMRDIELALRIEEVLTWLPTEKDALTGHSRRKVS